MLSTKSSIQENQKPRSQSDRLNLWQYITKREKQILIDRIQIQKDTILIEFGIETNSLFKAIGIGQQNFEATKPKKEQEISSNKPTNNEPLMSEKKAAESLAISKITLMRRQKANRISYYRVGFRILYSKEKHLFAIFRKMREIKG